MSPSSGARLPRCCPYFSVFHLTFSSIPAGYVCPSSLYSVSLLLSLSLSPSLCSSHSVSLSSGHRLSYSVSCSQTVSDSTSILGLWLSLPPASWLLPKGSAPTLHAWISLPISLSPWGEEQEEQAKGRQQPRFHEGRQF